MELVTAPAEVLHRPAGRVEDFDVARKLALDMVKFASVLTKPEAVGLAAPQVGISAAMFVWRESGLHDRWHAAANPELEIVDRTIIRETEGCLSVPGRWLNKPRATAVVLRYYDLFLGAERELGAIGFHARVLQHETDHLAGKLFNDRAVQPEKPDKPARPRPTKKKKSKRR